MIDVVYNKSRLFIFNTVENISSGSISKYWTKSDKELITDYIKSVTDQLFKSRTEANRDFCTYFNCYTNIYKMHIYLYPLAVAEKYCGKNQSEALKEAFRVKNLLSKTIRKNSMSVIDQFNNEIVSMMRGYDKKRIRVVYHLNDQNFLEDNKKKGDTIYIYEINKPYPLIKRKM